MTDDELTREEAVALADDLGNQLYRAEDRLAFVREMLAGRTEPVDPATVLAWLDRQHCSRVESEQQQIKRLTAERDQYAAGIPLICADDRHEAKVRGLEALLAAGQKATEHWEGAYTREVAAHGQTERTLREARNRRGSALMVTDHTYEGEPGHGQHCETERFGQTCGAAWEQHQMRDCQHPDTWFDRTICPEPCGAMHDRCTNCGETVNPCELDARTTVDNPLTSTNAVDNPKEQQ